MASFSARLHVVCIVDDELHAGDPPQYACDYPFVLFNANDDDDAFRRALELGKNQETTYKNSNGDTVRWAFRAVEEIWRLPDQMDGIEIGSILDVYEPDERLCIDDKFEPQKITPQYSDASESDGRCKI